MAADIFKNIPLPYNFLEIPDVDDKPIESKNNLKYFVNLIITELSTNAFSHCGFERVDRKKKFNMTWGRQYHIAEYSTFKSWQKINHFAGANQLGRKDFFHQRFLELKERTGIVPTFYPTSYISKKDSDIIDEVWKTRRLWIIKPFASARGEGIYLLDSTLHMPPIADVIVQYYIENPLLITGRKFDLRFYVMVTSCSPLRIYMHESGLVRFSTREYSKNASYKDRKCHLTNFSLNKDDTNFVRAVGSHEKIEDSKWSIPFFIQYLEDNGYDKDAIFRNIEEVIVSTFIIGFNKVRSVHNLQVKHRQNTCEIYGIDIILDENLNPYVLEVNISPAMSGKDSSLDYKIKYKLMHDILRMDRIIDCDPTLNDPCPELDNLEIECRNSLTASRIASVENGQDPWEDPRFDDYMNVRDYLEEQERLGGFHMIYPLKENCHNYDKYFDRIKYHDIVLQKFIEMDEAQQVRVLNKNIEEYRRIINSL